MRLREFTNYKPTILFEIISTSFWCNAMHFVGLFIDFLDGHNHVLSIMCVHKLTMCVRIVRIQNLSLYFSLGRAGKGRSFKKMPTHRPQWKWKYFEHRDHLKPIPVCNCGHWGWRGSIENNKGYTINHLIKRRNQWTRQTTATTANTTTFSKIEIEIPKSESENDGFELFLLFFFFN